MRKHETDSKCRTFYVFKKGFVLFKYVSVIKVKSEEYMNKVLLMISGGQVLPGAVYTLQQKTSIFAKLASCASLLTLSLWNIHSFVLSYLPGTGVYSLSLF